ncbi:hypothetical protein HV357_02615 [Enterobacter cloacae]|uniref:Peptide IlvX n=1 Tax=Enterobacter sichuanensis TaxID=2071710 RepID=A0AAE4E0W6_9ENTR|nr:MULTISPECIES: peptide IlvX [Enterobacter cloacae complex]MBA7849402.1 hypothetical protein [Enterobacter cloacae]MCL9633012.1 peptide IlvX [Enterobacter ludwigii]MCU6231168.1 peptide IlvX [Enterobacter cloacae]MDR9949019.1 peptide IlvX [Enterobacter sichuanensis]MRM13640.1 hypothetical protein [Enterobacter cloacae subsp. dissolvens]
MINSTKFCFSRFMTGN